MELDPANRYLLETALHVNIKDAQVSFPYLTGTDVNNYIFSIHLLALHATLGINATNSIVSQLSRA